MHFYIKLYLKNNVVSLEYETISHSVTIVPRLEYSEKIINEIIQTLKKKKAEIRKSNKVLFSEFDEKNKDHKNALKFEKTISFSLEILVKIQKRTKSISDVKIIPETLSSSIQMIRTISAELFDIAPKCSQKLSELSIHLGSIVLDSGALTKARFDFGQSNKESSALLDEVKLIVDSKLSKQYPNLESSKLSRN